MEGKLQVWLTTPDFGPQLIRIGRFQFAEAGLHMDVIHEVIVPCEWQPLTSEEFGRELWQVLDLVINSVLEAA